METKVCFEKEMFFSKTYPSFLTLKEGSTFLTKPLFPQGREDVTALRCSEPLRFMVGGASKPSPCFAGCDRMGITLFSDILLVTCRFFAFSLVVSQKMHNFAT